MRNTAGANALWLLWLSLAGFRFMSRKRRIPLQDSARRWRSELALDLVAFADALSAALVLCDRIRHRHLDALLRRDRYRRRVGVGGKPELTGIDLYRAGFVAHRDGAIGHIHVQAIGRRLAAGGGNAAAVVLA